VKKGGRPAWMNREILLEIKRKKRLWQRTKNGGITDEYRAAENRVKKLIRKEKRKFEKELADGDGGNNRRFFAYVKKKTKSRPAVGPLKNGKGEMLSGDKEMADELNMFFSSVFSKEGDGEVPRASDKPGGKLEDMRITEWAIKKKIRKLRKEAAAGPDEIGPRLLMELEDAVATALCLIFRKSLATGEVPEDWRRANVTPIFKKGTHADPGNYRPVSLTSVCCKVMESLIRDRLMGHLMGNNLIEKSQHGFMPGKSCTTNLLEFLEEVTKAVDAGQPVDVVYLDFAKAFDKVPRKRLMEKLRAHGVAGNIHRWIRNWLSGRQQRVVLNGKSSEWADVLSGVPQGSVLGPVLFLVYINDLDDEVRMVSTVKKFADDTKLGQRAATAEERQRLQEALDNLGVWARRWEMKFNVKKCKVVHIGHGNVEQEYMMDGEKLTAASEEVDIGVTVNKNLKPSQQCAKAARTAQAVLGQLARAFHYRDRHIFVRLYTQYVRPHLEFSVPAWAPWQEADKECIEKVQKRMVAMVTGLAGRTYEERLTELGMVSLAERRHQLDMVQTYKILTGGERTM